MKSARVPPPRPIVLLSLLSVFAAGCPGQQGESKLDYSASVKKTPVVRGDVERVLTTTGTVRAREDAKLFAEAGGKLQVQKNPSTGRRWAIGDDVRQGQLIAIVAAEDLRTSSRIDARKQALDVAEAEHARNRKLQEDGLVSDTVMQDLDAKLSNARAEYQNAVLQQSKARVVAPIGGVLTTVTLAGDGEYVNERALVAQVMRFDEAIVDLDLGAGDVLGVTPGLDVRIESPAPGSQIGAGPAPIHGRIERVAPAIDPTTRTFRVEVGVDNADHRLRPGMFVRADIVLDARKGVLVVPSVAVLDRDGKWIVFVDEAQHAMQRPVEIGLASQDVVEITSGLSEGDEVITSGQETLQDNSRITVSQ